MMWITNGTEDKMVRASEPIPENWRKGRINARIGFRKKESKAKGTIWITNGIDDLRVREVDDIPEGYILGRKKRGNVNGTNITAQQPTDGCIQQNSVSAG